MQCKERICRMGNCGSWMVLVVRELGLRVGETALSWWYAPIKGDSFKSHWYYRVLVIIFMTIRYLRSETYFLLLFKAKKLRLSKSFVNSIRIFGIWILLQKYLWSPPFQWADFWFVREKWKILRMCLEIDMKNLGVRRSLHSLHEFALQTRTVGLLQIPLSLHCCATATPPCVSEPTEKPNTFFSKDKNQIEKFPLSDFFPDYNLL